MTATTEHTTRHTVDVAAPADAVFAVIADAPSWPVVFPPTVHVRREQGPGDTELLDIWASAKDTVKSWRSERVLDRAAREVRFRQRVPAPPLTAMSGVWRVHPAGDTTTVELDHTFVTDPASVAWVEQALDTNSTAELAALAAATAGDASVATFAFSDTVAVRAPAQPVFDFLYRADLWPDRLPHVSRVDLSTLGDAQVLEMDTVNDAGQAHTTRSYRVETGRFELSYKQTVLPDGFLAHHGRWAIEETGDAIAVTSHHRVRVDVARLQELLGAADRAAVEQAVRAALGGNSRRTLAAAKAFAEGRHPVA
jgi:aromatase